MIPALVAYDILLTFSREISLRWNRKFSLVTVLYVFNRYAALLELMVTISQRDNIPRGIDHVR